MVSFLDSEDVAVVTDMTLDEEVFNQSVLLLKYLGLKQFPSFFKLWLMHGQLEERSDNLEQAKETYESGLKHYPALHFIPLRLSLANLDKKICGLNRARTILTMSRKKNPQNLKLWLASVRTELQHDYKTEAGVMISKALPECPKRGILWALPIEMAPHPQQKIQEFRSYQKRCISAEPKDGEKWQSISDLAIESILKKVAVL
ncbi:RNA splicing factor [Lithospermum erythrorhizon]|uniref:RNA splicing factor n=1 Tax=Lithospermum erythrorhizon TaxID=34254 RepID=A0AAV3RP53_LITER